MLSVPADDLDYVSHLGHLDLIVEKIQEKLMGKEEVVFAPEEVREFRDIPAGAESHFNTSSVEMLRNLLVLSQTKL